MYRMNKTRVIASVLLLALLLTSCTAVSTTKLNTSSTSRPASSGSTGTSAADPAPESAAAPVQTPSPEPVSTPEPTPAPTPTPEPIVTSVKLGSETADEILALAENPYLTYVDATRCTEYDALVRLQELLPNCEVSYFYSINEMTYSSHVTEIKVDSSEGLMEHLRYLPRVQTVDMTSFRPTFAEIDALQAAYPDVFFLFIVRFAGFEVRSDITCFSTLCSPFESSDIHYTSPDLEPLFKYCTRLRALDIGHNSLRDISYMSRLTDLRVLIIADNQWITDLSPLGALKNLEYLELFTTCRARNFDFLNELTNLRYLNISNCITLMNIDFLQYMPKLEKLWIMKQNGLTKAINAAKEQYPNVQIVNQCVVNGDSVTCCGWRAFDTNVAIRTAFTNWRHVVRFNSPEDIVYDGSEITPWPPEYEHWMPEP